MSLHPKPIGEIPEETRRIAQAAFPKGNLYMKMRDELARFTGMRTLKSCFRVMANRRKAPGGWR
jgi:hypothetical protein